MLAMIGCVPIEDNDQPPGPSSFYYSVHYDYDHQGRPGHPYVEKNPYICYGSVYPYNYNAIDCDYYVTSIAICCKWFDDGCVVTLCNSDEICGWHFTKEVCEY